MSDQIRPSEISEVLLAQLKDIDTDPRFEEVGTVLQVSDGVVRIHGLKKAEAGELLEFVDGIKAVVMNLEEDNVGAVLLGPTDKIKEGMSISRTRKIASLNVGEGMVGRVVNPLLQRSACRRGCGNAFGEKGSRSDLPSACDPAVADRT